MASQLTVTTNTAGVNAAKSLNGAVAATDEAGMDVFAALLGTAAPAPEPANQTAALTLGNLVNMSLGFGGAGAEDDQTDDAEPIAVAIDAVIPFATSEPTPPELTAVVDGLADLKAKLAAGDPLDPEALKRLDAGLAKLAETLGIDLDTMPSRDELTQMVSAIPADDTSVEAELTATLAPLAKSLIDGTATPADTSADVTDLAKAVGGKIAAIVAALNSDDQPAAAQVTVAADTDPDFQAAMAKLVNPPVTVVAEPVLATPALKLPEAVTASVDASAEPDSATDSNKSAEPTLAASSPTKTPEHSAEPKSDKRDDDKKPEPKPVAAVAQVDKQPEATGTQQPAQAARAEIVAAPRVIQAGYQTSQQQLNLPQLAFELVRQVNDGNTRFQMRLDPPELGKIDVRLEIDSSGQVNAKLTVEKAETLDLMQRDQRGLEKALQQAGLDSAKTNLEFSLKQNPFSGGQQGQNGNGRNSFFTNDLVEAEDAPPPTVNLYRGSLSASGVNILA